MRKCCVCGKVVGDDDGYEVLGYTYHAECFPIMLLADKTRCYYCHKIMRKGDAVVSLASIGCGGREDLVCEKCTQKHFGRNKKGRK